MPANRWLHAVTSHLGRRMNLRRSRPRQAQRSTYPRHAGYPILTGQAPNPGPPAPRTPPTPSWREAAAHWFDESLLESGGVLAVDINDFGSVCSVWGAAVGDQLLDEVHRVLGDVAGPEGLVLRRSGDRFVVLLVGTAERIGQAAQEIHTRVQRIAHPARSQHDTEPWRPVTVSVGAAIHPRDAVTLPDLVVVAETLLFAAKSYGDSVRVSRSLPDWLARSEKSA